MYLFNVLTSTPTNGFFSGAVQQIKLIRPFCFSALWAAARQACGQHKHQAPTYGHGIKRTCGKIQCFSIDTVELDIIEMHFCTFLTSNNEHFIDQVDTDNFARLTNNLRRRNRRFSRARGNIKQSGAGGYSG